VAPFPPSDPPSPWWTPSIHADRRPFLLARNAITRAVRGWFEDQGFIEVEAAALQVSPGNETHLHAFETRMLSLAGEPDQTFYLHTSPEFACKKLLAAGEEKISTSPGCGAIVSAGRCTIPSSSCWSGTAPTRRTRP
jgi:lysyl-tRNA synthetase class 2